MDDLDSEWRRKGATLSDKTAQEEFGLTREEIVRAVRPGEASLPGAIHAWKPLASASSAGRGCAR